MNSGDVESDAADNDDGQGKGKGQKGMTNGNGKSTQEGSVMHDDLGDLDPTARHHDHQDQRRQNVGRVPQTALKQTYSLQRNKLWKMRTSMSWTMFVKNLGNAQNRNCCFDF